MAPSATVPDALAALDEIKAPAGVVLPPKEIKGQQHSCSFLFLVLIVHRHLDPLLTLNPAILEKTAGYVARNGAVFEGVIYLPNAMPAEWRILIPAS